jgi:tetratricopeptide (TPR) repeat protein
MDRGDYEAATAALAAIESPESLIPFKIDLKYAKAVSADPSKFNIEEALARRLKFLQEAVKRNPDRLSGIRALAAVYRAYNMPEDSLKLTQKSLDQVRGSPDGKSLFTDQEKYLSWLYHDNGRALFRLGRLDEGLKAFERAAHRSTGEGIDLGLSLNLAYKLISLGRAADALDEVVEIPMNSLSNYGKMVRQSSVACANAQLGRKEGAASALAYLKAHSSDAPGAHLDALLCLGDLDQAAKLIIAQLESPEQRHEVLKELQDYPKPPHWTDWDRQMRERLISVRDRADVQKVLTRFGRIEFFNIHL